MNRQLFTNIKLTSFSIRFVAAFPQNVAFFIIDHRRVSIGIWIAFFQNRTIGAHQVVILFIVAVGTIMRRWVISNYVLIDIFISGKWNEIK